MGDVKKSGAGNDFKQGFVVSTQVVCDFFEISRKTLAQWEHKGAPKEGRGKWDLKKLVDWRYSGQNEESPAARKIKAEADLKEAKAAQEQIKLSTVKQDAEPEKIHAGSRPQRRCRAGVTGPRCGGSGPERSG